MRLPYGQTIKLIFFILEISSHLTKNSCHWNSLMKSASSCLRSQKLLHLWLRLNHYSAWAAETSKNNPFRRYFRRVTETIISCWADGWCWIISTDLYTGISHYSHRSLRNSTQMVLRYSVNSLPNFWFHYLNGGFGTKVKMDGPQLDGIGWSKPMKINSYKTVTVYKDFHLLNRVNLQRHRPLSYDRSFSLLFCSYLTAEIITASKNKR